MPLFTQATSGGGVGRLKYEALWEEVHRFVGIVYTASFKTRQIFRRSPAMRQTQVFEIRCLISNR